jgi:serine/threonine-protein kinase RsbW
MPQQEGGDELPSVNALLESTLDSVDTAEAEALRIAGEIGFEEEDLHKIGMAVRECMVNAVVHGNRYNARKRVHLKIVRKPDRLEISVRDEGEGFDVAALPDPLAEENLLRQSGRGLLLIQAFMDEFAVHRAAAGGTEVTMVKYLAKAS